MWFSAFQRTFILLLEPPGSFSHHVWPTQMGTAFLQCLLPFSSPCLVLWDAAETLFLKRVFLVLTLLPAAPTLMVSSRFWKRCTISQTRVFTQGMALTERWLGNFRWPCSEPWSLRDWVIQHKAPRLASGSEGMGCNHAHAAACPSRAWRAFGCPPAQLASAEAWPVEGSNRLPSPCVGRMPLTHRYGPNRTSRWWNIFE